MGQVYVAKNLSDYIKVIGSITKSIKSIDKRYEIWFRGQEDCNYRLTPSGLRQIKEKTMCQYMRKGEDVEIIKLDKLLQNFKRKSINNLENTPSSEIEWLIIAQHYGLSTQLLDWTTNALIGLYFSLPDKDSIYRINYNDLMSIAKQHDLSLDDIKNMGEYELCKLKYNDSYDEKNIDEDNLTYSGRMENGAVVYAMSPNILNNKTVGVNMPIYVGDKEVQKDMEIFMNANTENYDIILKSISNKAISDAPLCINCNEIDKRIKNQSGCFTLHGYYCAPLDFYAMFKDDIHKIYIPYDCVEKIRRQLKECGIDKYFVYQDLNSLAEELNREELEMFYSK
ncbi:FRG domain-containing protein [Clostridium butyricum]|uniref:FRG domain-containing protein n=1 Tax=Clostridium butyricum TaxID=1492 RepID=UPI0016527234|nr:FRG domain-containing protein [Clostridium butyricum]